MASTNETKKLLYSRRLLFSLAVVSIAISGCLLSEGLPDQPLPFLSYSLSLKDHKLNIIGVTIHVFGAAGKEVAIGEPEHGEGTCIEPIGLCANDSRGERLHVKGQGGRWIVKSNGRDFRINYDVVLTIEDVYSPDIRRMLTFLDSDHCRIKGSDVFMVPEMSVSEGVLVDVVLLPSWEIHSARRSVGNRLIIPALEDLPSTVMVAGNYRFLNSSSCGADLSLAIAGDWSFEDEELFLVIRRIVTREIDLFGSSPYEKYLFVCDRNPVRGGEGFDYYGVHFADNVVLLLDPRLDRSELFGTPMAVIAHEFFHNWNGEALRPRSDDFLWFTEGATVYYSYRILLDLRIITPSQYMVQRDAIIKRYIENSYLGSVPIVSAANNDLGDKDMVNLLYDGGYLAAEAIDNRLSEISGGQVGLIDVLRRMYEQERDGAGIDEETLLRSINDLCGYDLSGFLAELIHEPMPATFAKFKLSS